MSYGVSFVMIWEKISFVITARFNGTALYFTVAAVAIAWLQRKQHLSNMTINLWTQGNATDAQVLKHQAISIHNAD